MGRILAVFGGLVGLLLVPLALAGPTAWLLLPAHGVFALLATAGSVVEGVAGRPQRARLWLLGYLVASVAMVAGMELGSMVRGQSYWTLPLAILLLWAWIPAAVAGVAGWFGEHRLLARTRRSRRRRRRIRTARAEAGSEE